VLDAFVRALPYSFRDVPAVEGATVLLEISGASGGRWFLCRDSEKWELFLDAGAPSAEVVLSEDTAWRLFTKGLRSEEAARRAVVRGDSALAAQVFATIAVIG